MKKTFLLLLILFVVVGCSHNDQDFKEEMSQKSSFPSAKDLVGTWQMYYQSVDAKLKDESSFFYNQQTWVFLKEGYVKTMSVKTKANDDEMVAFFNAARKTTRYSVDKNGVVTLKQAEGEDLIFEVRVITGDMKNKLRRSSPQLKKEDLLFLYTKASSDGPYLQRFVRRIELPETKSDNAFTTPQSGSYDKETGNVYF